ncbi:MFS transporter [Actinoplanes sp. TBRC 11911]|uniref:MFS transporter n=1 Tax=Actinoplanes sp. TBRC 11911 TaxID=2729386 RepID=UPI00145D3829|nr:MFS transporter [Actinoplanes sp. TBRC 11911]NMO52344.1 MFS transporter [Actinoplanes sp. TBRC 11911]
MARSKAVLWIVLIAQFMVVLDATIVTVALPSIQSGLHFDSQTQLQWVINAYILLFGGFLLFGGRAGDLLGRQRLFIIGLALFGLSSLVNGLAQNSETLIVGRAVQGLGGALTSPAVLSIILVTFESVKDRTKALGAFSAVTASGSGAGMLAGGILTEWVDWRAIFLVNVPIAAIAIIGAIKVVANSRHRIEGQKNRMDLPGAVTITAGLMLLVYAIVNADDWGWGSGKFIGFVAGAAALIVAFFVIESVSKQPLVRLGIFRHRALAVSNGSMLLMTGGVFVMMFFPVLYWAEIKGYSPIKVGLAFLPWPAAMAVASTFAQKLIGKAGPKAALWPGLLIIAGGLFWLGFVHPTSNYAGDFLPGMLLTAIGAGFAWASLFLVASVGVKPEESGLASGLINTSQQLGSAIGLAILASVAAAYTSSLVADGTPANDALVKGFDRGFMIGAAVLVASALVAFLGLRARDGRHTPEETPVEPSPDEVPSVALEPAMGD